MNLLAYLQSISFSKGWWFVILVFVATFSSMILLDTNIILKMKFDEGIAFHQFGVPRGRIENFDFELNAVNLIFSTTFILGVVGSFIIFVEDIRDYSKKRRVVMHELEEPKAKPAKEDQIPWWESL